MPTKINGTARAMQSLTKDIEYYVCFCKPNISVTGNLADISQRNFEVLIQAIGLRAMPVILSNPTAESDLAAAGSTITGSGYLWKFACETSDAFHNFRPYGTVGPVGHLVDELHGVVLPNAVVLDTKTASKNIEFVKFETL